MLIQYYDTDFTPCQELFYNLSVFIVVYGWDSPSPTTAAFLAGSGRLVEENSELQSFFGFCQSAKGCVSLDPESVPEPKELLLDDVHPSNIAMWCDTVCHEFPLRYIVVVMPIGCSVLGRGTYPMLTR
jgi:hypothetical protein